MTEQNSKAEALFEALNQNKKQRKRKLIRTVLIIIAVIAAILISAVIILRKNVEKYLTNQRKWSTLEWYIAYGRSPARNGRMKKRF